MEKMADQNDSKKAHSAEEDVSPSAQEESTSSEQTALDTNDLAKDVVDLKVQVARVEEKVEFLSQIVEEKTKSLSQIMEEKTKSLSQIVEEKTKSIPQIDERVRSIERLVWRTSGVLALLVILVPLVRFLLSFLDITIALKP